LNSRVRSIGTK